MRAVKPKSKFEKIPDAYMVLCMPENQQNPTEVRRPTEHSALAFARTALLAMPEGSAAGVFPLYEEEPGLMRRAFRRTNDNVIEVDLGTKVIK